MWLELFVVDDIKTAIRYEGLRDANAFLCLVVLQNSGHDTWQSESRTVERMTKLGFLSLSITVAALQTVSLIGVEVRDRRDLKPTALGLGVNLKVIADGASKALIATAKQQDPVRELQLLQQSLDMC